MVGAYFEALNKGVLMVPLDSRYTQVGFNFISVQVRVRRNLFVNGFEVEDKNPNFVPEGDKMFINICSKYIN